MELPRSLRRQLARPRGLGGLVAGEVMGWQNVALVDWALSLLGVGRGERLLEVGFGSGLGIRRALARARAAGLVAGIDPSEVMVRRALLRNRWAVRAGRVDLRQGSVTDLPWPAQSFTSAFAINGFNEWPSAERGLAELRRVLAPGAHLALTTEARGLHRSLSAVGEAIAGQVAASGFQVVRLARRRIRSRHALCVLGMVPVGDDRAMLSATSSQQPNLAR